MSISRDVDCRTPRSLQNWHALFWNITLVVSIVERSSVIFKNIACSFREMSTARHLASWGNDMLWFCSQARTMVTNIVLSGKNINNFNFSIEFLSIFSKFFLKFPSFCVFRANSRKINECFVSFLKIMRKSFIFSNFQKKALQNFRNFLFYFRLKIITPI